MIPEQAARNEVPEICYHSLQWEARMRSLLAFLLLSLFSSLLVSAQTIDPQTGAVCESRPADMDAVRSKAAIGDASAEYELGRSMLSTTPTDSEFASAMPWFRRSAEQGYAPAQYIYGSLFRDGRWKDPKQLVYWWKKAAEQGNVHAQLWLGVYHEDGRDGVSRDYSEALKWLSMAAKQGQPDAQVMLGQMYENGEGVPQDYSSAAYWYRKAADHTVNLGGAGLGANNLLQLYENGHATPEDNVFLYMAYAYRQDKGGMNALARSMNPTQIADAQRRVQAWMNPLKVCSASANISSLTRQ